MKYLFILLCCFFSIESFAQNQEGNQTNKTSNNDYSTDTIHDQNSYLLPVFTRVCLTGLLKQTCTKITHVTK